MTANEDELDEIFSLKFIAAPEMLIVTEGLKFRWNQAWLRYTKSALLKLISDSERRAVVEELNNIPIMFLTDEGYMPSENHEYIVDRLSELTLEVAQDEQTH